jgi:hypothetical protein
LKKSLLNIEYITVLVDNALIVKPKTKIWIRSILGIAVMAALIFVSSGRLDYWQGWVYFGINLAIVAVTFWILRNDPGLIAERLNPSQGTKIWDKGYFLLSTPLYFAAVLLVFRTVLEDNMLKKELLWYTEYAKAVRFRLVPGVW